MRSTLAQLTLPAGRAASLFLLLAGFALLPGSLPAQDQTPTAAPSRPTSRPYTGDLSVFDSPGRGRRLQIGRVMDLLGIGPGKVVADIGAGSGWFTVRAAARVGDGGSVYAEDINPRATAYVEKRAADEHLSNVHVVLGSPSDPKLPAGSFDAALMMKVYHEIADPVRFLTALRPDLKPHAKLGIIDRSGNGADHGVDRDIVVREAKAAGYKLEGAYDFTKADGQDYFLIFAAD